MIQVTEVSKVFQQKIALDNVSLDIPAGRVFGLIGPNGAGKTTLIRLLNQILIPSKGHITYQGTPLNAAHVRSFGYLPEERGLYREMKVLEHLMFLGQLRGLSKKDAKMAALEWLEKFDAHSWSNRKISALSKGMAQKIQFIGSVLHNPEVIILDEPLSGFDPINVEMLLDSIKGFKAEGKSVIFSTLLIKLLLLKLPFFPFFLHFNTYILLRILFFAINFYRFKTNFISYFFPHITIGYITISLLYRF